MPLVLPSQPAAGEPPWSVRYTHGYRGDCTRELEEKEYLCSQLTHGFALEAFASDKALLGLLIQQALGVQHCVNNDFRDRRKEYPGN